MDKLTDREKQIEELKNLIVDIDTMRTDNASRQAELLDLSVKVRNAIKELKEPEPEMELPKINDLILIMDNEDVIGAGFFQEISGNDYVLSSLKGEYNPDSDDIFHYATNLYTWQYPQRQYKYKDLYDAWNQDIFSENVVELLANLKPMESDELLIAARETVNEQVELRQYKYKDMDDIRFNTGKFAFGYSEIITLARETINEPVKSRKYQYETFKEFNSLSCYSYIEEKDFNTIRAVTNKPCIRDSTYGSNENSICSVCNHPAHEHRKQENNYSNLESIKIIDEIIESRSDSIESRAWEEVKSLINPIKQDYEKELIDNNCKYRYINHGLFNCKLGNECFGVGYICKNYQSKVEG